jgi:hypothetical protein
MAFRARTNRRLRCGHRRQPTHHPRRAGKPRGPAGARAAGSQVRGGVSPRRRGARRAARTWEGCQAQRLARTSPGAAEAGAG